MNRQAVNPYLPSWEYIPDGEPHVFNGRVYVYGSHDRFNAPIFCVNDYVCWSAPWKIFPNGGTRELSTAKNRTPKIHWDTICFLHRMSAKARTAGTTSTMRLTF